MCPLNSHQPWPPCRGEALVIGGDLAYPSPTNETYETRFFRPYEAAMPAPAHAVPGALVLQKPDLPLDGCSGCRAPPSQGCALHSEHGQRHQAAGACRWVLHNACLRQLQHLPHALSAIQSLNPPGPSKVVDRETVALRSTQLWVQRDAVSLSSQCQGCTKMHLTVAL